jgi:hypothetical protein
MKPSTWYFITDHAGLELAAFPERDLAESYMEDMPWEIEESVITTDSTFVSATLYDETLRRAEKAEAEVERLKAEAEEYEWLKRQGWFYDAEAEQYTIEFRAPYCKDRRQAPRAAIDAAKGGAS